MAEEEEFNQRWKAIKKQTDELLTDIRNAYPDFINNHNKLLNPLPIDEVSCYDVYKETGEEYLGWDHADGYVFISTGPKYYKIWKLMKEVKLLDRMIHGLTEDELQAIEPLPQVKEFAHMYWQARSQNNLDEEKEAYELFEQACLESFLVYLGIGTNSFIKSANKDG